MKYYLLFFSSGAKILISSNLTLRTTLDRLTDRISTVDLDSVIRVDNKYVNKETIEHVIVEV